MLSHESSECFHSNRPESEHTHTSTSAVITVRAAARASHRWLTLFRSATSEEQALQHCSFSRSHGGRGGHTHAPSEGGGRSLKCTSAVKIRLAVREVRACTLIFNYLHVFCVFPCSSQCGDIHVFRHCGDSPELMGTKRNKVPKICNLVLADRLLLLVNRCFFFNSRDLWPFVNFGCFLVEVME